MQIYNAIFSKYFENINILELQLWEYASNCRMASSIDASAEAYYSTHL